MEDFDIDVELLIKLMRDRPVLWDKSQECYKNRQANCAAWREIYNALSDDFETLSEKEKYNFGREVTKKWTNARDNWMKYNKHIQKYNSGSGIKKQKKYKFYDEMLFLKKVVNDHNTESKSRENIGKSRREKSESITDNELIYFENESSVSANTSASKNTNKKRKTDATDLDRQTISLIKSMESEESKSMCFFKSISPIVDKYTDEDYVEFQFEVTKIMRKITQTNRGRGCRASTSMTSSSAQFEYETAVMNSIKLENDSDTSQSSEDPL